MGIKNYLENKVILIIGAASGIGKALIEEIVLYSPKKIILGDIDEEAVRSLNIRTDNTGMIEVYRVDVSSERSIRQLFDDIIKRNKRIDVVFNNAGTTTGGEFQDHTFDDWNNIIKVNLWGVIYCTTFAYKQMIKQRHGHIINISSLCGLMPEPMVSAYSATEHAVVGLTATLRDEAFSYGVNISVVCPGVINTPIVGGTANPGIVFKKKVTYSTLKDVDIFSGVYVKKILKQVARNKGVILVNTMDKIFWKVYRYYPQLISVFNRWIVKYFRENFRLS